MNFEAATVRRTLRSLRLGEAAVSVTGSRRGAVHRTGLAALVAALVLGILGMHALASHGTPATPALSLNTASMDGMTGGTAADVPDQVRHSSQGHGSQAADVIPQTDRLSGDVSVRGSGHGSDDAMSMLMLCAVMLTVGALALVVLLIVGIVRPPLPASFHPAAVRARALPTAGGAGPPREWQFSVIRC